MIERLAEDHANARRLAEGLAAMDGIVSAGRHRPAGARAAWTRPASARTSSCSGSSATGPRSSTRSVRGTCLMVEYPHGQVRAVTHHGVAAADIETHPGRRPPPPCARRPPAPRRRRHRRHGGARAGRHRRTSVTEPTIDDVPADPRPLRRRTAGRSTTGSTTSSRRASGGSFATTRTLATFVRHPHRGRPARRRQPRRRPRRDRRGPGPPRGGRGDRPGRAVRRGALRARPRAPQPPPRAVRRAMSCACWERRSTALDARRRRAVPAVRPRLRPARRAARRDRRPPRGGPRVPRGEPDAGRPSPRSACGRGSRSSRRTSCPSLFDEIVAAGRRRPAARPSCAGSTRAVGREPRQRSPSTPTWLRGHARRRRRTTGRSGASATTSSSACAPSTASTRTRSSRSAGSSSRANRAARVAAAREIDPTVDEPTVVDRIKRDHPADLRGGARRLPRRRCCRARAAPHRPRHRDRPGRRADRRHRDARVPAQRHPVRRLLRAAQVRRAIRSGIYVVTPSVGDDPNAMREHNYSSISNTSIHEAYPGHHLQLASPAGTRR